MKYSVRIRRKALLNIEKAAEWFLKEQPGLEIKYLHDLGSSIENIRKNPLKYQVRYKDVRIKFLSKFSFGIHYIIADNVIHILAVFHISQSSENWT